MDPRRWRRVCDVFQATLGHDAGERAGFLADESLGDEGIRQAVEELLRAHESAGDFLEVPAAVSFLADGQILAAVLASDPVQARTEFTGMDPVSWLLNAAVACCEGRPDLAPDHPARAAAGFDRAEMQLYAAVTRRRLGALLEGDRGRDLVRQADEWMAAQGVRNPALLTRMLAPGFPDQATIM
jgi:hypothetical protein